MKRILAGIICYIILGHCGEAQSIYSSQGLGSLNHQGMPNNVAMGEVGIGSPNIWHINTLNPANLIYNSFSTFQVGLELDKRNFSGEDISGSDIYGGLRFLGYAFPIILNKWSSSIGILPYSSVNYNIFSERSIVNIPNSKQTSNTRGEGGLTNFYWANGFKIKKKILVGIKANYLFGAIEKTTTSIAGTDIAISNTSYTEQESYSDLSFLFGLAYQHNLTEKTFMNFGIIFSPKSNFNGTSKSSLNFLLTNGHKIETPGASNTVSENINFDQPTIFGFGISYEKLNHYIIGLDFETQTWSNSRKNSQVYNDAIKISIGIEWTPDYDNISSYWKRVKYSTGFNYHRIPYIVNDQTLTDFGINFGVSLPVSGFSSLDLAFKWGQLGKSSNKLVKETYYKIVMGATINDRWFVKRKYD